MQSGGSGVWQPRIRRAPASSGSVWHSRRSRPGNASGGKAPLPNGQAAASATSLASWQASSTLTATQRRRRRASARESVVAQGAGFLGRNAVKPATHARYQDCYDAVLRWASWGRPPPDEQGWDRLVERFLEMLYANGEGAGTARYVLLG